MVVLMSNWFNGVQSLPENYIFPPDKRPGKHVFPVLEDVPLVDLGKVEDVCGRDKIICQIIRACQEFGFFQVMNHGVSQSLMDDTMNILKEFFASSPEYKAGFYSTDTTKKCRIYSSTMNYDNEEVHYWRDNFTHHCHPLQDQIHLWPDKPSRYREVVGKYSEEVRKLMLQVLDFIGERLGLQCGYFDSDLSALQLMSVNHHIPCLDPSLTLGMPQHTDPNLITVLQECLVPGLQVLHRGEWMNIQPIPEAFIVIPGLQLKVISNGKFNSPIHRVMTHEKEARTTIGTFLIPSQDILIEPTKDYNDKAPLIYKGFTYKDFYKTFIESSCDANVALRRFQKTPKIIGIE